MGNYMNPEVLKLLSDFELVELMKRMMEKNETRENIAQVVKEIERRKPNFKATRKTNGKGTVCGN